MGTMIRGQEPTPGDENRQQVTSDAPMGALPWQPYTDEPYPPLDYSGDYAPPQPPRKRRRWLVWILASIGVLVVVGIVAAVASGSSKHQGASVSSSPDIVVTAPQPFGETPSPGGPTSVVGAPPAPEHPAIADVAISKCQLADNEYEGPEATLVVTNHSSETSSYYVTVAFESFDHATQFDTGYASVDSLAPGQQTTVTATSFRGDLRDLGTGFTCNAQVMRLAS